MYHHLEHSKRYALRIALRQIRLGAILAVFPFAFWLTAPNYGVELYSLAGIGLFILFTEFRRSKKTLALASISLPDWISIIGTHIYFGGLAVITGGLGSPLGGLILLPGILYYLEFGTWILTLNFAMAVILGFIGHYYQVNLFQNPIRFQIMTVIIYIVTLAILASYQKIIQHQDERIRRLLTRDELTGLYNRRFLKNKIGEVQKQRAAFALIILDINYFKYYNDHWGHASGDTLLAQVGKVLKSAVGDSHFAVRYSGDEFVLLLVSVSPPEVESILQRVHRHIEEESFPGEECFPNRKLTLSHGYVFVPEGTAPSDNLFREADRLLYQSKKLR